MNRLFDVERPSIEVIKQKLADHRDTMVFSCAENGKYDITAELERSFIYIASDVMEARRAVRLIKEYSSRDVVYVPEREDPLRMGQVSNEIRKERVDALYKLASGEALGAVVTVEGLMQYFPSKEHFLSSSVRLKKGDEISVEELVDRVVGAGYKREDTVERAGSFSLHGDRFEIFVIGRELPSRLSFFGDEIEEIKEYAPDTRVSVRELDELTILPFNDTLVSRNAIDRTLNAFQYKMKTARKEEYELLEKLSDMVADTPYFLVPFFLDEMVFLDDYLYDPVVIFSDVKTTDGLTEQKYKQFEARLKNYVLSHGCLKEHAFAVPNRAAVYKALEKRVKLGFSLILNGGGAFEPQELLNIKSLSVDKYYRNRDGLIYDLNNWSYKGFTVAICAPNEPAAKNFSKGLLEEGVHAPFGLEPIKEKITVVPWNISSGFVFPEEKLVLIGTEDIFGRSRAFVKREDYKKKSAVAPKKGDYVVHERFGIGISEGINSVKTPYGYKDYYVVLYKDGDRLYVPPDQMDEIELWSGSGTPTIHKLGGKEFEKIKERVKASAKSMAIDLLSLYERRERVKGHVYSEDSEFQKELEDSFPYEETDDQLRAVKEIKEDMESGKVMDRLLAGDVGFGKTEVALRAMFKTVWDGKQAALLCPTTILAEQHYNTIKDRLEKFGVEPVILSRLQSAKEIKKNIADIASGKAQIIVATHRLLSSDVAFHDLGLLVLDEEQRFGVEHKEKIKALKANVNVLTMSATPIPRTLHMALSGIRDISLLTEPPKNRLPVETYVTEYSDALAVDAIRKEVARDGQVFILYNDVKRIEEYSARLSEQLGDVKVVFAHGRMSAKEMDERIRLFYNKQARVLVATTIIENGVDIPDANTIIIRGADKLGLSSLYQLKGRVGRSDVSAYAYFTVENSIVGDNALKRLSAIMECDELGSGFRLAERDLEIRGAGNVLGREQHGNMEKVGYEMYVRLIREAVDELRGVQKEEILDVEMKTEGEEHVPESYIKREEERVECMKRCRAIRGREERIKYIEELKDAYGKLPDSVLNLMDLGEIKNICTRLGIKTASIGRQTYLALTDISAVEKGHILESLSTFVENVTFSVRKEPVVEFRLDRMKYREKLIFVRRFLETAL